LQQNLFYSFENRNTMGRFKPEHIEKFADTVERFNNMFKS